MAKRGDRMAAKRRRQEREKQRRHAGPERDPRPEAFGIKMPPPTAPGRPVARPDFSEIDWDKLKASYPDGAHGLMRAMFLGLIGDRVLRTFSGISGARSRSRLAP